MHFLVLIGVFISVLTHFSYIKDTLIGMTMPNRVSWLMWSLAPLIAVGAGFSDGARWVLVPIFAEGLISFLVFLSSFVNPRAYWKLGMFDYLCGFFSFIALMFLLVLREPALSVVFAIAGDAFATLPTIVKAWKAPESESGIAYIGALAASLTSFFAVTTWAFTEVGFTIFLVIFNGILVFALYRPPVLRRS